MKTLHKIILAGLLAGAIASGTGLMIKNKIGDVIGYSGVAIYGLSALSAGVVYFRDKKR